MDELISRRSAIDAIVAQTIGYTVDEIKAECEENIFNENGYLGGLKDAIEAIEDMQSAHPEKRTEERTETHACDCIERQAAIEAHYEYCNKHPDAGFPVWSLKILENLPSAQPERRWIPVTERLPERNLVVLVTTKWGEVTEGVKLSGEAWFIGRGEENAFDSDIIAWMPLPEPYREGEG